MVLDSVDKTLHPVPCFEVFPAPLEHGLLIVGNEAILAQFTPVTVLLETTLTRIYGILELAFPSCDRNVNLHCVCDRNRVGRLPRNILGAPQVSASGLSPTQRGEDEAQRH